jgi:hypothetical protein
LLFSKKSHGHHTEGTQASNGILGRTLFHFGDQMLENTGCARWKSEKTQPLQAHLLIVRLRTYGKTIGGTQALAASGAE